MVDKSQDVIMIMITRSIFVCAFLVINLSQYHRLSSDILSILFVGTAIVSLPPDPLDRAPDYVINHPFMCTLQANLRQATNQIITDVATYTQLIAQKMQLSEENRCLKAEIQVLSSKVQAGLQKGKLWGEVPVGFLLERWHFAAEKWSHLGRWKGWETSLTCFQSPVD